MNLLQNYRNAIVLAVLLGICLSGTGVFETGRCRAVSPAELKYFKLVQMPGIKGSELVYVRLDDELYKFSNADYGDIRVFTSKKEEIPRVIEQEMTGEEPRIEQYDPAETTVRYEAGKGQTVIDVSMVRQPLTGFA
ncbi:MAG TPA: hypothetical protein PLV45_09535, partial [bacterium]|nr:hypothetical protein [bacterium]